MKCPKCGLEKMLVNGVVTKVMIPVAGKHCCLNCGAFTPPVKVSTSGETGHTNGHGAQ